MNSAYFFPHLLPLCRYLSPLLVAKKPKHSFFVAKDLKLKIKLLFGAPLFTPNLAYFKLWDDLMVDCKAKALEMGRAMQKYFEDSQLGDTLGAAAPNLFGRLQRKSESSSAAPHTAVLEVVPCDEKECTKRQDNILPMAFPRNPKYSQVQPFLTSIPIQNAACSQFIFFDNSFLTHGTCLTHKTVFVLTALAILACPH